MGFVTVCSEGAAYAYDETHSWPTSMALVYFTLTYITRSPMSSLLFAYLWESFEFFILFTWAHLTADTESAFARWVLSIMPESALHSTYPANHHHTHEEPCVLSPTFAFILNPMLFFGSVLLWSFAVERVAGIRYNTERALSQRGLSTIYYAGFFFMIFFSSTNVFVRHANVGEIATITQDIHGTQFDPDIGMLMATLVFIVITATIPIHVARHAKHGGADGREARDAYVAYMVYVVFVAFMAVFSTLGGPLLNIRSSWMTTMIALCVLWSACFLYGAVRVGFEARRYLGNSI